ncbi:tryptophan--tRNA ligase [Coemansia asiatica]|uniref:Tryptophan--tRNA ligase, cytoplasmic n=1 Tax=Coemansia asiatica TaxID=1052880 RepID=A0A9W7XQZ7_9FUNG|nr:tryptophan--tRNA ligase [Coemansia asiatica]
MTENTQTAKTDAMPVEQVANLKVVSSEVEQNITPWTVEGAVVNGEQQAVNYDKLIAQFGTRKITSELLERFTAVTGHQPHLYLRRGIFFSHRDLEKILDRYEQGKPFYLYTGRGPSRGHMHVGHMTPFIFCKWLQDVFDVPLVVQLTDDEKFLFKKELTVDQVHKYAIDTVREIAAVGFKPEKTFIFSNMDYMGGAFYRNVLQISNLVTLSQARSAFGFVGESNIGQVHFPSIQAAPALCSTFPGIFGSRRDAACLIPCGIDQDPYFRITRDVCPRLKHPKPSLLHARFLPALQGSKSKMSSSIDSSAIFMNDTPAQIKNKINRYAFSGGRTSLEEHRMYGGDPEVDVAYQFLTYFVEDDQELEQLAVDYRKGEISTGEMKARCIRVLQEFVAGFQEREKAITQEQVEQFMDPNYPRHFASLNNNDNSKK